MKMWLCERVCNKNISNFDSWKKGNFGRTKERLKTRKDICEAFQVRQLPDLAACERWRCLRYRMHKFGDFFFG